MKKTESGMMDKDAEKHDLPRLLAELSSPFTDNAAPAAIVLAAGQGKRIKSNRSKMLHKIWGVATAVRVAEAARQGLDSPNQVIVVGIKARDVAEALGRARGRIFAYQEEQKGTGHAVKIALETLAEARPERDFFVFPGDMGLIDAGSVRSFREAFAASGAHMMVMVGTFAGDTADNYYGRVLRVPPRDADGKNSNADTGKIIQIIEYKDILALDPAVPYRVTFRGRTYAFSRDELLKLREYNSGLYAFKGKYLAELSQRLGYDNVQGEMYLTDLIYLFNQAGLVVAGAPPLSEEELLGFNDKAVLNQMEAIARARVHAKLGKIISIADKDSFFIADDVVRHVLELDRAGAARDIALSEGAYLGEGVRLSEGVHIGRGARLEGSVVLGRGVVIGDSVQVSCFPGQTVMIGERTRILKDDVLKGNITIGQNCLIEAPVRLTGSDETPLVIGDNVRIKGDSYIYGSRIADNCFIINCILREVRVECRCDAKGNPVPVCYIFPEPGGRECIAPL